MKSLKEAALQCLRESSKLDAIANKEKVITMIDVTGKKLTGTFQYGNEEEYAIVYGDPVRGEVIEFPEDTLSISGNKITFNDSFDDYM
jgi:hypothetical protein